MKLLEILDKPLPFKVVGDGDFTWMAAFAAGDRVIKFEAENEGAMDDDDEGEWTIVFGEKVKNSDEYPTYNYDKTGSGNEIEVFSTLKSIIAKFINDKKPETVVFSADKSGKNNRARLYAKLFKKNLPAGWRLETEDEHNPHLPVYFMIVKEALDKPTDWQIVKHEDDRFTASFMSNGRKIIFDAEPDYRNKDIWEIGFEERKETIKFQGHQQYNTTIKKSGSGKEFEVFATVKAIIDEFIKLYNPKQIEISSFKGEENRGKLYARMIKNNLPSGWKMEKDEAHPSYITFKLVKEGMMKRSDPYISGEKSGIRPPDVGQSPRPASAHRSKLETLAKKSGKSYEAVEKAWNKAAKSVPDGPKKWANVMIYVKSDLGISI